jgi:hypothetical protein
MLRIPYAPAALYSPTNTIFCFWYSFPLEAELEVSGKLKKKIIYFIADETLDFPAYSTVSI